MTRSTRATSAIDHLALIGNFLPRKCGLATYTPDTFTALTDRFPAMKIDVYAMDDHPGSYDYPPAVTCAIPDLERRAYIEAARASEASGAQAVWLQHEYGIFGGPAGEHILALLDRISLPLNDTLHTVLETPDPDQRRVMEALLRRAARVDVMAERGREILQRVYSANARTTLTIPHGVPDRALLDTAAFKHRFGWEGRKTILTFGLLAPGKGIETMIEAMPAIVAEHDDSLYVVLGATHPNLVAHEGEAYRERLQAQAETLGVADHVVFVDAFVEYEDLLDYLQAADIYATPYTNPAQITSGTLSYAVGLGKAVVSTPYVHASEILADGHGVLVEFRDSAGFARAINTLLGDDEARRALSARAYERGRTLIWSRLDAAAMTELAAMVAAKPHRIAPPPSYRALAPDFAAVERMSDATGMFQHAILSVPDRRHGYCIDDNARALMLAARLPDMDEALRDKWMTIYAAFEQYAWNPDTRRFRNFMNFDRTWCEDSGSEDSNGRALWALGVTARDAGLAKHCEWARRLFDETASLALALGSPRSHAFAMLGAEALLRAGIALGRQELIDCGCDALDWIASQQTAPDGRFRAVGTESFGRPYADPLPFDQQPLEAQATIDACEAAFEATGDARWINEAMRAYRWYLGRNDHDLPLATAQDGGCFDGLTPVGLNRNQGAESILALQLASVAISGLSNRSTAVAGTSRAVA